MFTEKLTDHITPAFIRFIDSRAQLYGLACKLREAPPFIPQEVVGTKMTDELADIIRHATACDCAISKAKIFTKILKGEEQDVQSDIDDVLTDNVTIDDVKMTLSRILSMLIQYKGLTFNFKLPPNMKVELVNLEGVDTSNLTDVFDSIINDMSVARNIKGAVFVDDLKQGKEDFDKFVEYLSSLDEQETEDLLDEAVMMKLMG